MKVLKKGRPQKGWAKKFSCTGAGNGGGGCGAELLVEKDDVFTTSSSHYDGTTDTYCTFKCCECGVSNMPPASTPVSMRREATILATRRA